VTAPSHDLSRLRIDRDAAPKKGSNLPAIIGGIIALALAGGVAWWALGQEVVSVQVVTATALDANGGGATTPGGSVAVTANGYVVARTRAAVAAKIPGRLVVLNVSEGTFVRKDAILAQLENADYIAGVEEARANLSNARAQLLEAESDRDQTRREADRLTRIRAERPELTSQAELDVAESRAVQGAARANAAAARVEAAQAGLRRAEATLESTFIRAPFTGTVLRKEAELGEVVAPSVGGGLTRGAVVTMADLSTLEVEVDVNEAYIGRVFHGQEARITLDAYPDTSFAGTVRQVVPTADRQRATVQVKVAIRDRDSRILPEMGARVDLVAKEEARSVANAAATPSAPRFRLPSDAVRTAGGKTLVWLVREGRLESREVDAGPVSAGFREIRRGLSGGEQVLLSGVAEPVAGMKVTVATP
jgi:HlyD family secretion protein